MAGLVDRSSSGTFDDGITPSESQQGKYLRPLQVLKWSAQLPNVFM